MLRMNKVDLHDYNLIVSTDTILTTLARSRGYFITSLVPPLCITLPSRDNEQPDVKMDKLKRKKARALTCYTEEGIREDE